MTLDEAKAMYPVGTPVVCENPDVDRPHVEGNVEFVTYGPIVVVRDHESQELSSWHVSRGYITKL